MIEDPAGGKQVGVFTVRYFSRGYVINSLKQSQTPGECLVVQVGCARMVTSWAGPLQTFLLDSGIVYATVSRCCFSPNLTAYLSPPMAVEV